MKTGKHLLGLLSVMVIAVCLSFVSRAEAADYSMEARLAENDIHYTITTKETVLEGSRFIIKVSEGVYLPDTTVEDFEALYDAIEQTMGLKFLTKNNKEKVQIEVETVESDNESEAGSAWGGYGIVHLSPVDILLREGEGFAPVHESLHCLNAINGNMLCSTMAEGWTTHFTEVILASENYPFFANFNSSDNYSYFKVSIDESNAEKIFLELEKDPESHGLDGWDSYLYGYRFLTFLSEEYGDRAIVEFYTDPQFGDGHLQYVDAGGFEPVPAYVDKLVAKIKAAFGKDVFKKFGKWMQSPKGFEAHGYESVDCTKLNRINVFPYFGYEPMYSLRKMEISDEMSFDFKSGNEYLEKYKGYKNERIDGDITYNNQGVLYFYDSCGNLLETIPLDFEERYYTGEGYARFSVDGAELMVVRCENGSVNVRLNFDRMNARASVPAQKDTEEKVLKKNDSFTDKNTKAVYKVTKTGRNPEVRFVKTTGTKDPAVRIPDSVKYKGVVYKVTSVNAKALKGNKNIKTLYIGENVKNIYSYAFYGCKNLKTIFVENPNEIKLGKSVYKGISGKAVFIK